MKLPATILVILIVVSCIMAGLVGAQAIDLAVELRLSSLEASDSTQTAQIATIVAPPSPTPEYLNLINGTTTTWLNWRECPGLKCKAGGTLRPGTKVTYIAESCRVIDQIEWCQLNTNDQRWVSRRYVK